MAATAHGEVVKGPGSLVISAYCDMPDITKKVTPDFKLGDGGRIIMVDIVQGKRRTGGSALDTRNTLSFAFISMTAPIDLVIYLAQPPVLQQRGDALVGVALLLVQLRGTAMQTLRNVRVRHGETENGP